MRLGYFAMPMHPPTRPWQETLTEDQEAVVLADELGFHDAFIGEHLTDRYETITNSMLFLATLVHRTKQIRLGTGTTNLSHQHPALVAVNAAMLDHLTDGRFILGVSPGALPSDAELLGILEEDRGSIFADAVEVIVKLWETEPPYDIEAGRFAVSTRRTIDWDLGVGIIARPKQTPRPEIVGTVVAPYSKGVIAMGEKDFHPLSANFLLPGWVATHWPNYVQGRSQVGASANVDDWRVARTIFVADDKSKARSYGKDDPHSPYRAYYSQMLRKMAKIGRLDLFKSDIGQPDDAVTIDKVLDDLVIVGTPDSVAEQILELVDTTGEFGELVYAGLDWADPTLSKRSMELMASDVMPSVNAALALR